ncbi:ATP-binding protein [bacterium]|nr:ATP-binding protein [bacterium]
MNTNQYDTARHLLSIAEEVEKYNDNLGKQDSLSELILTQATHDDILFVCNILEQYSLTVEDILIIAVVFKAYILDADRKVRSLEIVNKIFPEFDRRMEALLSLQSLIRRSILDLRDVSTSFKNISVVVKNQESHYSLTQIIGSSLILQESFLNEVLCEKSESLSLQNQPYSDNREFLEGYFKYISALKELRRWIKIYHDDMIDCSEEIARIRTAKELHNSRLRYSELRFPFTEFAEDESLDENEQNLIMYMLREELDGNDCTLNELLDFLSNDRFEQHQMKFYFEPQSKIISRGLVEMSEGGNLAMHSDEVRLAPDISRRLLCRKPEGDNEQLQLILRGEEMFDVVNPTKTFDDVILAEDIRTKIETAAMRYQVDVDSKLRAWGIDKSPEGLRVGENDEAPLLLLFSGLSGTGKTISAEAFAERLGKKLIVTDISRMLSKWVGDSQKSVHRLFYLFDRIIRRCENPPVLLLNECDQFLSKRDSSNNTSVDRMFHQMQNLFLEGFERIRGVLIATTNLADSIDEAFSRRFHMKLEFPKPGKAERLALWKLHISSSIPQDKNLELEKLASKFELTGGQIALITRNAAIDVAVNNYPLTALKLREFCHMEINSSLTGNRKIIGF